MIYHGQRNLADLPSVVERTVTALAQKRKRFDSLVVTGLSGVIVGVPAALQLDIPIVIVRKESDDHHGTVRIINLASIGERYLIVDDFTDSGLTLNRLRRTISEASEARYAGVYLYGRNTLEDSYSPIGFRWPRTAPRATEKPCEPEPVSAQAQEIAGGITALALTGNAYYYCAPGPAGWRYIGTTVDDLPSLIPDAA